MKNVLCFCTILLLCCSFSVQAQQKFKGSVVDATDQKALAQATIMLLQAKDSILIAHTRAKENGSFELPRVDSLSYLLVVSYPKYGEYVQPLASSASANLGAIGLTTVSHLIEEVMVTGRIPVVIKGDTTEFDAGSFTVEKNAKVEDLLKVLPGISVDPSGKITAQGKTVEKVLVDGEEFFGSDPTLVTRNIRSDMVDKVQLYEKKSESAERTGVDDGERIQTINLTLKEDAKKGLFGKAEGGLGTEDIYMGKLAVNRFNGPQKIGAYILGANDGTISLNWEEDEKFGMSGSNMEVGDSGEVYYYMSGDEFSYWDGRGQPRALSGGFNFADGWQQGKYKLNLNYKFGRIENDIMERTLSQNNLPDGQLNMDNSSARESMAQKQRFSGKYDWKIDSLTTLSLSLSGSKGKLEVSNDIFASTRDINNQLLNENNRQQHTQSENSSLSYNAYLTRKFKKVGRSASLRVSGNNNEDDGDVFLKSTTNVYKNGLLDSVALIDQFKDVLRESRDFRTSVSYTEPLSKRLLTTVSYEYTNAESQSVNDSYNKDGAGNYTELDQEFSNDFDFNTHRHAGVLGVTYRAEIFEATFTNNLRSDNLYQRNNYESLDLKRDFTTYNPALRLRYNFTKNQVVRLDYNRNHILPSLTQIQPLRQNIDPLNIVTGNENLTPAKTDNYRMYYSSYNMMAGKHFYVSANWSQQRNAIQQNLIIQDDGVRNIFYENLSNQVNDNGSLWAGMGRDLIKKYKIKGNLGLSGNYSHGYNYLNGELNENTNYSYNADISINKYTNKNVDFRLSFQPGWRTMETSLSPERNSEGFTLNGGLWYKAYLPWKIALYGDLSYMYEAPTEAFNEKFERLLFKPGISRKFLKGENLSVDLSVNDMFNQNQGFRRYQNGNSITQTSYNTISRYVMMKVTWDFTTMKGAQ